MIAAILLAQLATPAMTAVVYRDVPREVVRVSVQRWGDAALPAAAADTVDRSDGRVVVQSVPGRRTVVLFERTDGAYLADGPFSWPAADTDRPLDRRWRRTIGAATPAPLQGAPPLEWLSADLVRSGEWPQCFWVDDRLWTCWGAPIGEPGVIVCRSSDRIWWTVVSRGGAMDLRSSKWGRLLFVQDRVGAVSGLEVRFAHPVSPVGRSRTLRLDTAAVAGAASTALADGVVWISGDEIPPGAWVDVRTAQSGPAYLALRDVADGPAALPLAVRLEETRSADGLALGTRDQRASGALVTLFRLLDPPPSQGSAREKPRRVLTAETIADDRGAFHLEGVGEAPYEVVAWHPQFGRASVPLPRTPGEVIVRLEASGTVRGRVVRGGQTLAGVDVISVPAPEAFMNAEDLVDLKGGDARTGIDGRFAVMLAAGGGGELRVGGGALPIKRIPLPRVPLPLLDLGDIDLGSPIEIGIVLDQDTPCAPRATGPIGQSGLQIVGASRTGPGLFRMIVPEPGVWAFELLCGREERALSPSTVQLSTAHAGREVRFSIR